MYEYSGILIIKVIRIRTIYAFHIKGWQFLLLKLFPIIIADKTAIEFPRRFSGSSTVLNKA